MKRESMDHKKLNLLTRRQAIRSLAAITAGTLIKPSSVFGVECVKSLTRFAVIGDWGTGGDDQFGLGKQMHETHSRAAFDFILSAGDNIYPNGSGRYLEKRFEEPFAALLRDRVPFYASLGNHDVEEGRYHQREYPLFNMGGRDYYTVRKGNGLAEFFMLDTTNFESTQAAWLENSLRVSNAKWKIAVFHHPLYSSGKKHGSDLKLRKQLEPLFVRYNLDMVFSGHDHFYERTTPQQGIQYFVTGAGGKTSRGSVDLKSELRKVSYDRDNHFMLIEIDDDELSFKAISETGEVVDEGLIKQA